MTEVSHHVPAAGLAAARPWATVLRAAAAMAGAMGVGRFVFTPILPMMHAQAGLSASAGAALATANYLGYLAGAVAGIVLPALGRSRAVLRVSLVALVATLALMPVTHAQAAWLALRAVAGAASAMVFMLAAGALLVRLRAHGGHLTGWAFGGVGAGIAVSGGVVLALRSAGTWQEAWVSAAVLAALASVAAWGLDTRGAPAGDGTARGGAPGHAFGALLASYSLEGVGYIVAGTFLVAAIDQAAPGWVGSGAWVLAGLAAVPSSALWAWLAGTWSRPTLLVAALVVQAVGIALPVASGTVGADLAAAVLFGGTFLGIATLSLATGAHLGTPRSVAILTTGYSVGQVAGPLIVTPVLGNGYRTALLIGAAVVAAAALAAGVLRRRFPHQLGPLPGRVRAAGARTRSGGAPFNVGDRRRPSTGAPT